jgi:hypothetical protein
MITANELKASGKFFLKIIKKKLGLCLQGRHVGND